MKPAIDSRSTADPEQRRRILERTRGKTNGSITRLVSPSNVGRLIKPFVFLDYIVLDSSSPMDASLHPHSGIATFTVILQGSLHIQDSKDKLQSLFEGGVHWMQAGRGVWHGGPCSCTGLVRLYRLWVSLPPTLELSEPSEMLLQHEAIPAEGPAHVLLGSFHGRNSPIAESLPLGMTYLHVRLSAGEHWRYAPARGQDVLWIAVYFGSLDAGELVSEGDLVVFEQSERSVDFVARESCSFMLGSAARSPFDLVEGAYSVHTNATALRFGEHEIARLGARLFADGRLSRLKRHRLN
jgi:redox-sensitive bicupin YhaK (pirin superfamily)